MDMREDGKRFRDQFYNELTQIESDNYHNSNNNNNNYPRSFNSLAKNSSVTNMQLNKYNNEANNKSATFKAPSFANTRDMNY
jgi:hypothetical protein